MVELRILMARLRGLFRERAIDEEMETHLSLLAADLERTGMSPAEARNAARRQFGGVAQIKETYRDQHRLPLVDSIAQDAAYGFRQMRRSPGFACAAILTLALGIGANSAVFRALDAVMFSSLPVSHPEELVQLEPLSFGKPSSLSYPLYRDLAAQARGVNGIVAAGDLFQIKTSVAGREIKLQDARLVTGNYFHVLGVACPIGRALAETDDRAGAPPVAVVSDRFWKQQLSASRETIGTILEINSVAVTIVGIAPPHFRGERMIFGNDVWLPLSLQPRLMGKDWLKTDQNQMSFLDVMARLAPSVSRQQAQAALDPVYRQLTHITSTTGDESLMVAPAWHGVSSLGDTVEGFLETPLLMLMAVVGLILVIACCNLANMLLARGAARTHEIGVRLALGAGRGRLVRQLLTESLLLSAIGTLLAVAAASWGAQMLAAWASDGLIEVPPGLSWRVLAFSAALSIVATSIFGLVPALAGSKLDLRSALGAGRRTATNASPRQSLGKLLVVAQVSISLLLLSGAALLTRSFWNVQHQDPGFRQENLLVADLPVEMSKDFPAENTRRFDVVRPLLYERMNALPGVRSAALVHGGPLSNGSSTTYFSVQGRESRSGDHGRVARISARYFEAMGIPLLAGRAIDESDRAKSQKTAVIGETAARTLFGNANAIGKLVSFSSRFEAKDAVEIVGVARDVRLPNQAGEFEMLLYVPMEQQPFPFSALVLRTEGDPAALARSVRTALQQIDSGLTLGEIQTAREVLDNLATGAEVLAWTAAVFGGLALLLAAIGVYGVLSYEVERRTQEMGIRLALGAQPRQVMGLVMRELGNLLGMGVLVGGAASVAGVTMLRSIFFGLTLWDASWTLLAGLVLLVVAGAAAILPARRAASLNLVDALRQE